MARQQVDPGRVLTPTQLLAAVLVVLLVTIPALITGAATVDSPSWVPGAFAIGAVAEAPLAMIIVYRLLTKFRSNLVNDERLAEELSRASLTSEHLNESLSKAGVDATSLFTGITATNQEVRAELAKVMGVVSRLEQQGVNSTILPPDVTLNAAMGLMAEKRWAEAAQYFDVYVRQVDDWEIHLIRGVAYANQRAGTATNLAALRAYSDAIALAPADADSSLVARLFGYRGAMAKRLGRLDEAESDLLLARRRASESYEIADIAYNLAAVYALGGRKSEALAEIRQLRGLGHVDIVKAHLDDYFMSLRDEPDFQKIINT